MVMEGQKELQGGGRTNWAVIDKSLFFLHRHTKHSPFKGFDTSTDFSARITRNLLLSHIRVSQC